MPKQKNQALVNLLFLMLLALPVIIPRFEATRPVPVKGESSFRFEEVAARSGVNFKHSAPVLDARLRHIEGQIASMGAGVAVADFDRDGWNDFYLTDSGENGQNRLYRNKHDGTFEDVAGRMGVADLNREPTKNGASMGAVWGDYDGDGFEDLLVYKWGRAQLFHNDGGKNFSDVSARANLPDWVNANNAIWLDYDRDGKLDLFLAGYFPEDINLWKLKTTRIMPESFEYAKNGGRKFLLHNLGGGRFEDVAEKVGITTRRWALAAVAADLRGSGYPDLIVANDYGVTEYFANDGGKFREIGRAAGIGYAPKSGMNASLGDVLNSGHPAIYVSNITEPGTLSQRNNLWVPREAKGADPHFDNMADSFGIGDGGWSFGAQFGDLDNDGALDIYLVNGFLSAERTRSYWYDYSKITGANSEIISDAKNWPPLAGMSLSGYQSKRVWMNDGLGSFRDVAARVGVTDLFDGRAVALADLWNRGTLDAVVANQNGPLLIYKNSASPYRNWVQFELLQSAIGARVTLFWNGKKQTQFITGGEGFCAQNQRRLHFGLGKKTAIERAEVVWPDGTKQVLTKPTINALNRIAKPAKNPEAA